MQLVINTYGSYLRKNGDCFLVKNEDKVFEVSVRKVDSIMITTSAYLSTDALKFAIENNIDVIFLDEFGDPYGRVWHSKLGSTVLIRRKQLEISSNQEGFELAKGWILQKIGNQIEFLEKLRRPREDKAGKLVDSPRILYLHVSGRVPVKQGLKPERNHHETKTFRFKKTWMPD